LEKTETTTATTSGRGTREKLEDAFMIAFTGVGYI
jgi:hypothetical protein